MGEFEDAVIRGDREKAWTYIRSLLSRKRERKAHSQIVYVIGKHFWWLSGEYFEVSGYMGWSPGSRDWDVLRSDYPPPTASALLHLKWFVSDLCAIRPSKVVSSMLSGGRLSALTINEAPVFRLLSTLRHLYLGRKIGFGLYDRIADTRSLYELGAARVFFWLLNAEKWWQVGLAGLILINARGLNRKDVRIRMLRDRRGQEELFTVEEIEEKVLIELLNF